MAIDIDEVIEQIYYFERSRRRSLYSQLSIPIAGLTVVGGGLLFLIQNYAYEPWGRLGAPTVLFFFVSGVGIVAGISSAWFAYQSLSHGDYPDGLNATSVTDRRREEVREEVIRDELLGEMASVAELTRRLNQVRDTKLYIANRLIGVLAASTVLAALVFLWRTFSEVAG
jgi:hypothetical protein